jgi:hypothetical protein
VAIFKDDVGEIILRMRQQIADTTEQLEKYTEKKEHELIQLGNDIDTLRKVVKDLPERQPKLFKTDGIEKVELSTGGKTIDVTDVKPEDIVKATKQMLDELPQAADVPASIQEAADRKALD